MTEAEEIQSKFKIICKKCGSENTVLHIDEGHDWGGETGRDPGTISIGCNACRNNDYYLSV